jgi:hypothetical protein|tara:strand:+ start:2379 stop:2588 length:210 start_codon:yes stop_codon:yes gene_type:complete
MGLVAELSTQRFTVGHKPDQAMGSRFKTGFFTGYYLGVNRSLPFERMNEWYRSIVRGRGIFTIKNDRLE